MNEERNPTTLRLESIPPLPLFLIFLILIVFVVGIYLILNDNVIGWPTAVGSAILVPALMLYRSKSTFTLNLAYGGFSLVHAGHSSSFVWNDIEGFAVSSGKSGKFVSFALSASGRKRCSSRDVFLLGGGREKPRLPDNFGMTAERLKDLMEEWHVRGRKT